LVKIWSLKQTKSQYHSFHQTPAATGATSAMKGEFGIIPGSMGVGSFIVKGRGNPMSWSSCSHGEHHLAFRGNFTGRYRRNSHSTTAIK
jgi:RNA-splicing ligase RtcB